MAAHDMILVQSLQSAADGVPVAASKSGPYMHIAVVLHDCAPGLKSWAPDLSHDSHDRHLYLYVHDHVGLSQLALSEAANGRVPSLIDHGASQASMETHHTPYFRACELEARG